MNMGAQIAYVGLGGLLGSVVRHLLLVTITSISVLGSHALLTANGIGSFLAGLLLPWFVDSHHWRLFVGIGFLGSLTTMSAFSVSSLEMLKVEKLSISLTSILFHVVLCIGLCAVGFVLGNKLRVLN
ncbi:MAG: CrcB family protein [Bdellovibrionota bacterium]